MNHNSRLSMNNDIISSAYISSSVLISEQLLRICFKIVLSVFFTQHFFSKTLVQKYSILWHTTGNLSHVKHGSNEASDSSLKSPSTCHLRNVFQAINSTGIDNKQDIILKKQVKYIDLG